MGRLCVLSEYRWIKVRPIQLYYFSCLRFARLFTSLGCLVTILSLLYSTFTQQLITLELAPSFLNATAPGNLPRSETWAQWGGTEFDALSCKSSRTARHVQRAHVSLAFDPGLNMIAALYNGVLAEAVEPSRPSCPSGNCTWPITPSMAVCGKCVDSTWVLQNCTDFDCIWTSPAGSVTTLYNFQSYGNGSNDGPGFQVVPSRGATFNTSLQDRLYVMNIDILGAPYWSFADSNPPFSGYECALWLCVNAYEVKINSTMQNVSVVASHARLNASWLNMKTSVLPFDGGTWYQYPSLGVELNAHNITFTVRLWAYMALQQYMYATMNGTVYWSTSQHFSNDLIRGIWNGTEDIDSWISNLATSMSNVVRSTNSSSRAEYSGTALALTVKVQWAWLTLPALLVFLSIGCLSATIIRTKQSTVNAWKGSPLTLLLCTLDADIKKDGNWQLRKRNGLENALGHRKVRLSEDSDTGILRLHGLSS